jgi:hypothetical protein
MVFIITPHCASYDYVDKLPHCLLKRKPILFSGLKRVAGEGVSDGTDRDMRGPVGFDAAVVRLFGRTLGASDQD